MDYNTVYWMTLIIPIILVFVAQGLLGSSFKKYSQVQNSRGLTGLQVARKILDNNGLHNVEVYQGQGVLSDYYDPTKNIIKLSPEVYSGTSIVSLAVAAHEVGHAIQYATKYPVIGIRNKLLPLTIGASNLSWAIIILGFFLSMSSGNFFVVYIGVALLAVIALFQIVTLPVEFNASSRALKILENDNFLTSEEIPKAKRVLNYAALTYVVALITTIAQIIRILVLTRGRD